MANTVRKKHKLRNCFLISLITAVWLLIALAAAVFALSAVPLESIGISQLGSINGQNAINAYRSLFSPIDKSIAAPFAYTADDVNSAQEKFFSAKASFVDSSGKADFSLILKDKVKLGGEVTLSGKEFAAVLDRALAAAFNTGKPTYLFERIEQVEFCDIGSGHVMRVVAAFNNEETAGAFGQMPVVGSLAMNPVLYFSVDFDLTYGENGMKINEARSYTFNDLDRNTGNAMIKTVMASLGMGEPETYANNLKVFIQTVLDHLGARTNDLDNLAIGNSLTEASL